MINFAPNNNVLLSLLTPNNPTTTAVAAQPQTSSTPQHTLGFPNGNTAASLLPSFSGTPANGSIFAGLMNPAGTNSPFTQQGQTPLAGMNTMPAATAPSGTDALGLAGLDQLLAGANKFASSMPPSLAGASTAGGISPTAPRSAALPTTPQTIALVLPLGYDPKQLQQGQNPTEEAQSSPEDLDLEAKIKKLEAEITEAKGTPSSDSELRIVALEKKLAEAKINKNGSALQARLDYAEEQIRALKKGAPIAKSTATPRPVVAQGTKPTSKTT
jgi:hypothetical protein